MKTGTLHQDNIFHGITLVASAVFMIAFMNALAKFLSAGYHPIEIVFYRNVLILLALVTYFSLRGQWHTLRTNRLKAQLLRGIVGTGGVVSAFWAVSELPLADAVTIMYSAPLFVTILSYPLLREKVGPYRIAAVIIGFAGVAIVAAPGGNSLPLLGVSFALCTAMLQGLTQTMLRDLGHTEPTMTTVFYFITIGTIITGIGVPFVWTGGPQIEDGGLLILLALAGGLQQILKTRGYALAPIVVTSPLNYTGLIWAALFGWAIWQDVPGYNVLIGGTLIIACNVIILWREQALKKKKIAPLA